MKALEPSLRTTERSGPFTPHGNDHRAPRPRGPAGHDSIIATNRTGILNVHRLPASYVEALAMLGTPQPPPTLHKGKERLSAASGPEEIARVAARRVVFTSAVMIIHFAAFKYIFLPI